MFSSCSPKRKNGTGRSKVSNKRVYFNPKTQEKTEDKQPSRDDWLYFDSELEFSVYLAFTPEEKSHCWQHHKIQIADGVHPIFWKPDFFFPLSKQIVEVKGEWILNRGNKADKALFVTQCSLAVNSGFQLILLGEKEFEIGPFQVHNYRNLRNLI